MVLISPEECKEGEFCSILTLPVSWLRFASFSSICDELKRAGLQNKSIIRSGLVMLRALRDSGAIREVSFAPRQGQSIHTVV